MNKPLIDNKDGIGLVAMFCQTVLDEQIAFVQKQASQLPLKTKEQGLEMAWDDSLEMPL